MLGGGGLKGMAHVGAWRALIEAGIRPKGIVGTSIGALVGALVASGMPPEEMVERACALERKDIARVNRRAVWINGIRQPSLFLGEPLREYYEGILPAGGWAALRLPVLMNAVDLGDGSTAWFGEGERKDFTLVDAVYASSALPVFYPPLTIDGRAYVDGGVTHQLGLEKAAERGAPAIIAIDVGASGEVDGQQVVDDGMVAVHQRVVSIMSWHRRRDRVSTWQGPPLLYVRPELDGYGTFDFAHVEYFLEEGYRAMREALGRG